MSAPRAISEALGSRVAEGAHLWRILTRRRSLVAYEASSVLREYVAACPKYVLLHHDVQAERALYFGFRSRKRLEETAREILGKALREAEGSP